MTTMGRHRLPTLLLTATALLVAACGSGGDETTAEGGPRLAERCPIGAIDEAGGPVEITFWHSMTESNLDTLTGLVRTFHGEQDDVRVRLVNQTSYDDTLTKYRAALEGGDVPDLVQIQDIDLQLMIDSRSVLPAQACVDAEDYALDDHLERVVAYYTVEDVLWPMPFNVSNPVLYYDKAAFRRAGLDPARPPATLDDVRTYAERIVASGTAKYGIALKLDAWQFEQWMGKAGAPFVDHGNGREGRATEVVFDGSEGLDIFRWLAGMERDGLAQVTSATGYDNLLAIGNQIAPMTIETSAALGTILAVLSGGDYADVELGVGPMPGPEGDGGVLVGGGALYLVDRSTPAEKEAAWRFARFLNEPEQQAAWSAGTGYLPIREAAVTLPAITTRWAEVPELRIAYDQLLEGSFNVATAGPVIGDYEGVRRAVIASWEEMFSQGLPPDQALRQAADDADDAIAAYERRVAR